MLTVCLREFYYVPDIVEYVEGAVGAVRNVNCSTRCAQKSLHWVSGYSSWDVTWCSLTSPCPHLYSPAYFTCVSKLIGDVLCPGCDVSSVVRILSRGRLFTIVPQCFIEKMIFKIVSCICFFDCVECACYVDVYKRQISMYNSCMLGSAKTTDELYYARGEINLLLELSLLLSYLNLHENEPAASFVIWVNYNVGQSAQCLFDQWLVVLITICGCDYYHQFAPDLCHPFPWVPC